MCLSSLGYILHTYILLTGKDIEHILDLYEKPILIPDHILVQFWEHIVWPSSLLAITVGVILVLYWLQISIWGQILVQLWGLYCWPNFIDWEWYWIDIGPSLAANFYETSNIGPIRGSYCESIFIIGITWGINWSNIGYEF